MQYKYLGDTQLQISALCLGTMTFGEQNDELEAFNQLDIATDAGINFIDTAEMYPIPARKVTYGITEEIIGRWLVSRKKRSKIIISTKVLGPSHEIDYVRNGLLSLNKINIITAVDHSLKRLNTDYIDLYWLHWPDRKTNFFGQLGYKHIEEFSIPLEESLYTLGQLIKDGKIRYIGISNETPWGVMSYLQLAKTKGLPRITSIQNPYSLLNRTYEIGLAEVSIRENCGLIAYSPLGHGVLTGKYTKNNVAFNARLKLYPQYTRYLGAKAEYAVNRYIQIAYEENIDPAQMAISFILDQPFVTSVIIGSTTISQLHNNLGSINIILTEKLKKKIEAVHMEHPNPCP